MSLRALRYLLTRRFSPRRIPRAQAESSPRIVFQGVLLSAAGRPARSLHSLRDLDVGYGSYGAVPAAALAAGLVGILLFKKHTDDDNSGAGDVTDEEAKGVQPVASNEVTLKKEASQDDATDDIEAMDMEARFEDWMKKHGRAYKDEQEKAKRFEIFKETVKRVESYRSASRPVVPNDFADMTKEEQLAMTGRLPLDEMRKEAEYVNHILKERYPPFKDRLARQPQFMLEPAPQPHQQDGNTASA